MTNPFQRLAATAALAGLLVPTTASAFPDCPADSGIDGYTCTELLGAGKKGDHFRVTIPSHWDGDLVIVNHGFDLNDQHIRAHEVCSHDANVACDEDADCGGGNFCNNISYLGLDEILLPLGKAVAASTYSTSGWAVFSAKKDLKNVMKFVKKAAKQNDYGAELERILVTGFSLGGAMTGEAILKLKIDGAVPLCGALGGGLPTWDVAQDIRMVYDFLCDGVPTGKFLSNPDQGEPNSSSSDDDAFYAALRVDSCFGVIGIQPDDGFQAQRLSDFLTLTGFTGYQGPNAAINTITAIAFSTFGVGDFVRDDARLKNKLIGNNIGMDYTGMGSDGPLAATLDAGIQRLDYGKGRKKLRKFSWPTFVKGRGKKVEYPIVSMPGADDWLVIPEFQTVYTNALDAGSKNYTQVWNDTYGHCVFTEEETTAVFNKFFEWLGPLGGPQGTQPTATDIEDECIAIGGILDDTCNFDLGYVAGQMYDRIPPRSDWPESALP